MMLTVLTMTAALGVSAPQQHEHGTTDDPRPVVLMEGMGNTHHRIQTRSDEAQKFFDQGLTFVYAFNHDEAVRSFRRAAALDPASPMPLWGVALALGPNINLDVDPAREQAAYDAAQQALALAARAPAIERAYVMALSKRYSKDPNADVKALAVQYADAMRALVRAYPKDDDAATLFAESLMDLRPWQLWSNDGAPAEGTQEILRVLETVLRRNPNHVGANHYYIHATEASPSPERALPSAKRLETLVPAAGHLVHMPAHTYMRTGNYAGAVDANARAADVDRKYIEATNADGFYPAMYYNHNLDFLASAAMMTGQFAEARKAADELVKNASDAMADMPMLEPFAAKTLYVLLRFSRWDDVLALPAPDDKAVLLTALYHFGRGVAHAAQGAPEQAERDRAAYQAVRLRVPAETPWGYNTAAAIFAVSDAVLDARVATAKHDVDGAINAWKRAVAAEDTLNYDEPSDWFYPTRESLGAAYLRAARFDEARLTFREDLKRNPGNGRSLYGWSQAAAGIDPSDPMVQVLDRQFSDAWKNADVELKITDY